jgi:hypothetical protein
MSFFGDIIGGYGASQLGKYNSSVTKNKLKLMQQKQKLEIKFIKQLKNQN